MPGGSRALPDRPNLRYLRLEAKRRLAAGEFATLHDAQTAIAREHGAQLPEIERPPVPSPVANAVKVMYLGAATSILGIIVDILTVNATKSAIERRSHKLTVSQVDAAQHALIVGFIVGGLVGAAAWIFIARNCRGGKNWARITETVLFAIATIDTIVGLTAPLAGAVKLWGVLVWLVGLTAVVFLWQRPSSEFFTASSRS